MTYDPNTNGYEPNGTPEEPSSSDSAGSSSYHTGSIPSQGYGSTASSSDFSYSAGSPSGNPSSSSSQPSSSYYSTGSQNRYPASSSPYGYNYQPPRQEKPHKEPKYMTRGFGTLLICLTLVLSMILGVGGGILAFNLMQEDEMLAASSSSASESSASSSQGAPATTLPSTSSGSSGSTDSLSVKEIAAVAADSVVEITTEVEMQSFWNTQTVEAGAGSGVIISEDGYIITNNHVIEDSNNVIVKLTNGETYPATLVGTDAETDIAIIKIEATGLKAATIGNSSELEVGDIVVAIGNPLGQLGGTVTDGIVSALDRTITTSDGETRNLMQTNAAVNPGNSGGGLFNDRGELIGIVNAKTSETGVEGLGFAIPIDDVKDIINDLMENGYVTGRPFMGATLVTINSPQTMMQAGVDRTGVYIYSLVENGASEQAGLQVGDYVLMVDGTVVSTSDEVKNIIRDHEVGDTVTFTILRGNETLEIPVTLAEQPAETASSGANSSANNG